MIQIETERMLLYPISDELMQEIIDTERDPDLKQAYTEMLHGCKKEPASRIWHAVWRMELKGPNKTVVGDFSFKGLDTDGKAEIGYGLKDGFFKKGYMTEALKAVSEWALKQPGVLQLLAETEPNNLASQKVLLNSGFVSAGISGSEGPLFTKTSDVGKVLHENGIGNKILVIGCSGSGKSEFSKRLHTCTGLSLFHLDNIWWNEDKKHITREEFDRELKKILDEDKWIIDGDYSRTYEQRLAACDTVFFLDYSEKICMEGIKSRVGERRTDIPFVENCLDEELVESVHAFFQTKREGLICLLKKYEKKRVIVFKTRGQSEAWLSGKINIG